MQAPIKLNTIEFKINRNKTVNNIEIINIIKEIEKFPPQQKMYISCNPLYIPYDIHNKIIELQNNINIDIIINLNIDLSLKYFINNSDNNNFNKFLNILNLYNFIIININTFNELELLKSFYNLITNKTIIISTNFSILNIFNFHDIKDFVKENKLQWNIGYMIFNDDNDERRLYKNEQPINFFKRFIIDALKEGVNIKFNDTMNNNKCTAGYNHLAILENGNVIPCSSMLMWHNNIQNLIQGNILCEDLQTIWENKFKDYRFYDFKCCKDVCDTPIIIKDEDYNDVTTEIDDDDIELEYINAYKP